MPGCTCVWAFYWPDCKPEGPLFSAEFVCLSVCLWPALLPFNVDRFWWNLDTRTQLWSSLVATIMVHIGRATPFWKFQKILKNHRIRISKFWSIIFCVCVSCVLQKKSTPFEQNWWRRYILKYVPIAITQVWTRHPRNAMRSPQVAPRARCNHQRAAACPYHHGRPHLRQGMT